MELLVFQVVLDPVTLLLETDLRVAVIAPTVFTASISEAFIVRMRVSAE